MDLTLYGQIARRWWVVLAVGLVLAVGTAFAAAFSISGDGLSFRSSETWSATQDVLVTEAGFPIGRTSPAPDPAQAGEAGTLDTSGRLSQIAAVYAELSSSDAVVAIMERDGSEVVGELSAQQFVTTQNSGLPLIRLEALASSEAEAISLVQRNSAAFSEFLEQRQDRAGIRPQDRVVLSEVRSVETGTLVSSRSLIAPAVAFIAVIALTVGIVLILQNLFPSRLPLLGGARDADESNGPASGEKPDDPAWGVAVASTDKPADKALR